MRTELAEALGKLTGAVIVGWVIAPLLLICGTNWLLEAHGATQFDYTWATWFGAALVCATIRVSARGSK